MLTNLCTSTLLTIISIFISTQIREKARAFDGCVVFDTSFSLRNIVECSYLLASSTLQWSITRMKFKRAATELTAKSLQCISLDIFHKKVSSKHTHWCTSLQPTVHKNEALRFWDPIIHSFLYEMNPRFKLAQQKFTAYYSLHHTHLIDCWIYVLLCCGRILLHF